MREIRTPLNQTKMKIKTTCPICKKEFETEESKDTLKLLNSKYTVREVFCSDKCQYEFTKRINKELEKRNKPLRGDFSSGRSHGI